jgi:hypothetical protein
MRSGHRLVCLLAVTLVTGLAAAPGAVADEGPQPLVLFEDQRTSGSIVLVDLAQMPDGGFVVMHEPAEDGLGPVAGTSTLLGAGLHQSVPVVLYDNVTATQDLIAVLYEDSNGNQVLDLGDGHDHHTHSHEGQDEAYTDGERPIGDRAQVEPQSASSAPQSVNPLLVGALTAVASLVLWAVRYR